MLKLAIPAVFGLVIAGAVVGGWVDNIINLSWRTEGTMFDKYATVYPEIRNPAPSEAAYCDPEYKARWAACSLTSEK